MWVSPGDQTRSREARSDLLQGDERLDDPYAVHVTSLGQRATMDDEQWRASRSSPALDVQMDSRTPCPKRPKGQTDPEQLRGSSPARRRRNADELLRGEDDAAQISRVIGTGEAEHGPQPGCG